MILKTTRKAKAKILKCKDFHMLCDFLGTKPDYKEEHQLLQNLNYQYLRVNKKLEEYSCNQKTYELFISHYIAKDGELSFFF